MCKKGCKCTIEKSTASVIGGGCKTPIFYSNNILSNYLSPGVVTGAMCPYPIVVRMVVVKKTDWIKSQLSV